MDEEVSNGVVHVVRSVLSPPNGDLITTVQWTPALQMSFGLLQNALIPDLFNGIRPSHCQLREVKLLNFIFVESEIITAFLPVDSPIMEEILASGTLSSPSMSTLKTKS